MFKVKNVSGKNRCFKLGAACTRASAVVVVVVVVVVVKGAETIKPRCDSTIKPEW